MDTNTLLFIAAGAAGVAAVLAFVFFNKGKSSSGGRGGRHVVIPDAEKLKPGKMGEFKVPGTDKSVLIVRTAKGAFKATGSKCPHANVSLAGGVLNGDRVVCPLHAACFDVNTGDIEDGPSFDKLPVFPVQVSADGKVSIELPASGEVPTRETPHMCPAHAIAAGKEVKQFLIIGAGPAALAAAETLRQNGFDGAITLLSREVNGEGGGVVYDRTKLNKKMDSRLSDIAIRKREFMVTHQINIREGVTVTRIDTAGKVVHLEDGKSMKYDKLLCASGGNPNRLLPGERFVVKGADLGHIHPIREAAHSAAVQKRAEEIAARPGGGHVIVVGAMFIGMEAAAYLKDNIEGELSVTVVDMVRMPFERVLGPKVGTYIQSVHEENGVKFEMETAVDEFLANPAKPDEIGSVRLKNGKVLPADLVIIGAGVTPATKYLEGTAGIQLHTAAPGGVVVDDRMRAGPDVWAAGDIAYFPYLYGAGGHIHNARIEHWDVAIDQGRCAAKNMLGMDSPYRSVPFFWTSQFGRSLRYAGHAPLGCDFVVHGDLKSGDANAKWMVFYLVGDDCVSVATFNRDPQAVAALELLRERAMPSAERIRSTAATASLDLVSILEQRAAHRAATASA